MKRKYKKTVFYVKNICYDDLENKKEKGALQKFKFAKRTEMILKFNRNDLKWQWELYAFVLCLCQLLSVNRTRNGKFSRAK